MGEKFCGKNLLIIYVFCRVEKRLPASHKMNDMKPVSVESADNTS